MISVETASAFACAAKDPRWKKILAARRIMSVWFSDQLNSSPIRFDIFLTSLSKLSSPLEPRKTCRDGLPLLLEEGGQNCKNTLQSNRSLGTHDLLHLLLCYRLAGADDGGGGGAARTMARFCAGTNDKNKNWESWEDKIITQYKKRMH